MLAAVLGLAYGGVMPLYSVLARDYFSPQVMGTVLGGITMTSSIGMAFGPVGGGWLFDTFGDYHWLYIGSAAHRSRRCGHGAGLPAAQKDELPTTTVPGLTDAGRPFDAGRVIGIRSLA